MGNLQLTNWNLTNPCIEYMTSEGIKNRPSRYGINIPLLKCNNILRLCPFIFKTLQNVYTMPIDPLFLNESGSALSFS